MSAVTETSARRLVSLDALRGFDMFWIVGAAALVRGFRGLSHTRFTDFLATQLEHTDWAGLHCYDLIFPLFLFLMGVAMVFSLPRTIEQKGRGAAVRRVLRRSVLLYLLGVFTNGGVAGYWPDIRLSGVLNRIAMVYFFAGLLFCFFKPRALMAMAVGLLAGYWALLAFVPIRDIHLERDHLIQRAQQAGDEQAVALFKEGKRPFAVRDDLAWMAAEKMFYATTNYVTGKFGKGYNLEDHFNFQYLPGRHYDGLRDPLGILSTMTAIVSCLFGVFAGLLLKHPLVPGRRKVTWLIAAGVACAALGWLWGLEFPVIKRIWSSSYVLVTGGYSAILMGVFYLVVDVWGFQKWCQPFVWIGMNSITVYMAEDLLGGFHSVAQRLAGGNVEAFFNHLAKGTGGLLVTFVGLLLMFGFVNFLYCRKIFLRL